jgi:hypothetical protein
MFEENKKLNENLTAEMHICNLQAVTSVSTGWSFFPDTVLAHLEVK